MTLRKTMVPLHPRDSFFRDEFFSDCWDVMERQKKEFEQKCAAEKVSHQLDSTFLDSSSRNRRTEEELFPRRLHQRYHPASLMIMDSDHLARKYSSGLGIHHDKDTFKVSLDVQQFTPEELVVKTVDNTIVIEGKHEEKEDHHGLVSRHFQRKYTLPSDVKMDQVQCSFTADGRLHITAPRQAPPITQNGTPKSSTSTVDYEKSTYGNKTEASKSYDTTSIDKLRQELKAAKEDYERTRTELLAKRAERQEEAFRQEITAAKERFDKSTSELLTKRAERQDTFREEVRKAQDDFDREASTLFTRDRDDFRHSRLQRMFEPHFTAFPEFDPLPFWRRGKTSTLAEEFDKKSSMFDQFATEGRFGKTSLVESPSEIQQDPDNFKVILDVHEFKPEELDVRTYDYYVEIEAKHEAKQDPHGFITRQFKRKYTLPRDVKATDVQCNLSSEGILVVTAPRQRPDELAKHPQTIPIQQKDPVSLVSVGQQKSRDSLTKLEEQIIEQKPKTYQNVSTVHQVFTEKTTTNGSAPREHHIPITTTSTATTSTSTTAQQQNGTKQNERLIRIDQEILSPGPRVDFPESRPDSSASSIPFDFSRGKSEEPNSVASSVPPTFENLNVATNAAATVGPGERLIKIQLAH